MLEPSPELSYAEQEERRRVFWSVYLLDRLVSCGRGRPPAIVDACCQLQLPCDEQTWRDGMWQPTLTLDELANRTSRSVQHPGLFARVIIMAYTVGRAAQYMLQEFNIRSRYSPWDPSSDFAAIEADLLHLECHLEIDKPLVETLPLYFASAEQADYQSTGPAIFSRLLFHLCYCMLTHPFLLRRRLEIGRITAPTSFLARMFDTAWHHAQRMVEIFRVANSHGCPFRSSFSGYCMLIAGSIAILYADHEEAAVSSKASMLLQEAILYLQDAGRYWRNVSTMVSSTCLVSPVEDFILTNLDRQRFCSKQLRTQLHTVSSPLSARKSLPCRRSVTRSCGRWWTTARSLMRNLQVGQAIRLQALICGLSHGSTSLVCRTIQGILAWSEVF
jgi:hypothetical protein